jgi:peptide/nickel transport system substrate-binding protein
MSVLPARGASAQPKRSGTITLATQNDLVTMNPMVRTASTERLMRMLMFDSLLGSDLQGKVQPNLAESWKPSSDGKIYTFRLRKGVMFHNGKELSSEDVKFSMSYTGIKWSDGNIRVIVPEYFMTITLD